jgi:hypothetical protein
MFADALRPRLRHLRVAVLAVVVLTLLSLGHSFLTYEGTAGGNADAVAPGELDSTLVAVVDGTGPGQLVAYDPNGTVEYRNRSLWLYHDVDPVPGKARTVEYVASDRTDAGRCSADDWCMENVVERVNLTTGEVRRVHTIVSDHDGSSQIHDVDRVNESVLLVGDIRYPDRVYMVNTTTDERIWEWRVAEAFEPDSGGSYPGDWTHLNDVEYLHDGRVMVNLRNQDQVVFVEPGTGIQRDWTLGSDGNHSRLYEQHNADYIPESDGGPAVLVADSENNRIVEFQRVDGSWKRSWVWADARLQWPRDADRLPDGDTLVADSHGSRLLSVSPNGSVDWSIPFPDGSYDLELLGTDDESDGPSAVAAGLESARPDGIGHRAVSLVPPLVLHGLLYSLPLWASAGDAVLLLGAGCLVTVWLVVEVGARLGPRLARRRDADT